MALAQQLESEDVNDIEEPSHVLMEEGANSTKPTVSTINHMMLSFALFIVSPPFLLVSGVSISIGIISEGFLCLITCSANSNSMRAYILSVYYIVFGLLSIGIECKFKFIDDYCSAILTYSGKGFWYLFLATLSFGPEWWSVLVAVFLIVNGMLNSYVGCSPNAGKRDNYLDKTVTEDVEVGNIDVEVDQDLDVELGKLDDGEERSQPQDGVEIERKIKQSVPSEV